MNKKSNTAAVAAYITWVGFIIALVIRDKTDPFTTQHINQALIINILSVIGGALAILPFVGGIISGIVNFVVLICWALGVFRAVPWSTEPLPVIGEIRIIN